MGWGMNNPRNIAVVTIDWSDDYAGSQLSGRHGSEGHERYNFLPVGGIYYGYFPPNGNNFPTPKAGSDWLIFFVSRPAKDSPAVVVGWYEDASIIGFAVRPDIDSLPERDDDNPFSYSATAEVAVCIPAAARDCVLPKGTSLRSFAFVRTDGEDSPSRAPLIEMLLAYRQRVEAGEFEGKARGGRAFPVDPELRKRVEDAAIAAVKEDYRDGFDFQDKQKALGTGYDLEFTDKSSGEVWCIEVKGTGGSRDAFFITRSERKAAEYMLAEERAGGSRRWRLALVTSALDVERRKIEYLDAEELEQRFDFECLQWQAVSKIEADA